MKTEAEVREYLEFLRDRDEIKADMDFGAGWSEAAHILYWILGEIDNEGSGFEEWRKEAGRKEFQRRLMTWKSSRVATVALIDPGPQVTF